MGMYYLWLYLYLMSSQMYYSTIDIVNLYNYTIYDMSAVLYSNIIAEKLLLILHSFLISFILHFYYYKSLAFNML